ncbi:phosphotransferase system cellobiose-specific component IIC [Microbacterium sp. HM58-2]|nr:phosphotransferase system cellobiose-specific component IIC [Microbacterium sp. HM58-2]
MRRTLNVVRLQLINRQTFIWVPLIIIVGATLLSVVVYALIPVDTPKYGGAGQAPLWYFFAIGMSAMTLTFPFSQAMSITRRDFFLGTMLTAVLGAVLMGVVFVLGGALELATNGYGVNGYVFHLPWLWEAGPFGAFLSAFTLALFFFVIGFTGATIYKSWGPLVLTIVSVALAVLLVGLMYLATRLELWGAVGDTIAALGSVGLALWGLVGVAVLAGISFLAFRRAIP